MRTLTSCRDKEEHISSYTEWPAVIVTDVSILKCSAEAPKPESSEDFSGEYTLS